MRQLLKRCMMMISKRLREQKEPPRPMEQNPSRTSLTMRHCRERLRESPNWLKAATPTREFLLRQRIEIEC
jgi:hypothetical protein